MDAYDIAAVHDSLSERFTYGHRIPDDNDDIVSHVVSGKISVGYRLETTDYVTRTAHVAVQTATE